MKKKVALITDGRFSGGTHGFSIGHVGPEAAVGGPIGLIKNGDIGKLTSMEANFGSDILTSFNFLGFLFGA